MTLLIAYILGVAFGWLVICQLEWLNDHPKCSWCGKRHDHMKKYYLNGYDFGNYCSHDCFEAAEQAFEAGVMRRYKEEQE